MSTLSPIPFLLAIGLLVLVGVARLILPARAVALEDAARRRIIEALVSDIARTGAALAAAAGLPSGRLYPALYWLESRGYISGKWQEGAYPRRCLYSITARGVAWAVEKGWLEP